MHTNMTVLSMQNILPLECTGALSIGVLSMPHPATPVPPTLRPTVVQATIPHDPWIDLVPFPAMRDSLILHRSDFDEDDFCCDMLGGLFEGFDDIELRGIMVWGDPWLEESYEVTEGFARKWRWLLEGCEQLMRSTENWRRKRGLASLVTAL
jgi:hypothetical protein